MTYVNKEIAEAVWNASEATNSIKVIAAQSPGSPSERTVSRLRAARAGFEQGRPDGAIATSTGWSSRRVAMLRQWWIACDASRSHTQTQHPDIAVGSTGDQESVSNEALRTAVFEAMKKVAYSSPHELVSEYALDSAALTRKVVSFLAPAPQPHRLRETVLRHAAVLGRPVSGIADMLAPYKVALPEACWFSIERWEESYGRYYDSMVGLIAATELAVEDLVEVAVKLGVGQEWTGLGKEPLPDYSLRNPFKGVPLGRRDVEWAAFIAQLPRALTADLIVELLIRVAGERPSQGIWAVEALRLGQLKQVAHLGITVISPTPVEPLYVSAMAENFWSLQGEGDHWELRAKATEAGVAFEEVRKAAVQVKENLTAFQRKSGH